MLSWFAESFLCYSPGPNEFQASFANIKHQIKNKNNKQTTNNKQQTTDNRQQTTKTNNK